MYVSSITQEVSLRGRGSTSITLHCTLLYRSTTQSVIHTNQRFKLHAARCLVYIRYKDTH